MQDKINFRLWLELDARSTFDSVKKDFLLQIIPIKVKNDDELNKKRLSEYDIELLKNKVYSWTLFDNLSDVSKMQINKILDSRNGTLADIINIFVND